MLENGVSKSSLQKAAGNSIVVACMEMIFEELWFPDNNVKIADDGQLCLF
jgi:site-specific DNA-cytosine methylase